MIAAQSEIDFSKAVWPTAEMLERARAESTDENLCIAWAANGDRSWWQSLAEYERNAWLHRYLFVRDQHQETAWRNGGRMWSCACVIGYGKRLKQRGLHCHRCGQEILLRHQPRYIVPMRTPAQELAAEEGCYQRNKETAERMAVDLRKAFLEGRPCPYKMEPRFQFLLDWAFDLASVNPASLVAAPITN